MLRAIALLVLCAILAGCQDAGVVKVTLPDRSPEKQKEDAVAKIVAHKWWKKKPTRARVDAIIGQIVKMDAGEALFFDSDANTKEGKTYKGSKFVIPPDGFPERNFFFYLDPSRGRRYTADEVAVGLVEQLDKADYEGS